MQQAENARKAFETHYEKLLTDQKAYQELAEYKSYLSCAGLNKAIMYGLVPVSILAMGAAHYKFPGKYVKE